jgi:hypothetical protein
VGADRVLEYRPKTHDGASTRISLVPHVWKPASFSVDENGFVTGDHPVWDWDGWDTADDVTAIASSVSVGISPADSVSNPGPVCVLTNSRAYALP